jgi:hypothetical protein
MKLKVQMALCRMPAGRCARVKMVDRKGKRVLMREFGYQRPFWVSMKTLGSKWRLPGTDKPVGKLSGS